MSEIDPETLHMHKMLRLVSRAIEGQHVSAEYGGNAPEDVQGILDQAFQMHAAEALEASEGEWTPLGVDHPEPRWYWITTGDPSHVYSASCACLWNTGEGTVIAEDITAEEWPTYGELLRWSKPIPIPPSPERARE